MRILFNGFQSDHTFPALLSICKELNLNYCATIDDLKRDPLFLELDHHDFWKTLWAEYPIPEYQLDPLDEDFIQRMAHCETVVLRMMDRLDPLHPKSYRFRKEMYLRHLQYWNHFLTNKRITHFVTINIPHEVHDYVAYCICKQKGIRVLMFWQSALPDATFLFENIEDGPIELKNSFSLAKDKFPPSIKACPLPDNFEIYWDTHANPNKTALSPFYMKDVQDQLKRTHSSFYVYKRAIEFSKKYIKEKNGATLYSLLSLLKESCKRYRQRRHLLQNDQKLWKAYNKISSKPDLTKPYIYIPLHYQPECTTCPMGGTFVDQDLMIKILATAVEPYNISLYIKEHPVQRSQGRSINFYETLRKMPTVTIVDREIASSKLIQHSLAVATVTGTAGWEALFEKKPVLMFGSFFFQYAPGVFSVRSLCECKSALSAIQSGVKSDLSELRLFLYAVSEIAVQGYSDANYQRISQLTSEQSATNIAKAILTRIKPID